MADETEGRHRHFILEGVTQSEPYRSPRHRSPREIRESLDVLPPDRLQHGWALLRQIDELRKKADSAGKTQLYARIDERIGLQVEFESFPDVALAFWSLSRERSGIELLNVRHEENRTLATVFVPDGKLKIYENLIKAYLNRSKDTKTGPRNHRLLNTISAIRAASLQALWTDTKEEFPDAEEESFWWEVWLPTRRDRQAVKLASESLARERLGVIDGFRQRIKGQGMEVAQGELNFPERTVLLVYASVNQMQRSMVTLNSIAELRRPKETAEFFDSLQANEQIEWLDDLLDLTQFADETGQTPYVCLLDTGVNRHLLLDAALATDDLHTIKPDWGTGDNVNGHGTRMAGLALVGNMTELLDGNNPIEINHRLESVKLLPPDDAPQIDPHLYGYWTAEAVARPEITAPARRRVFGMCVTARENRDRGQPSAWSAATDSLAADVNGYGASPRLLVVAAGNIEDINAWAEYPQSNDTDGIHDPAQAWNALTVGAYTNLVQITESDASDCVPVAPEGGLSPFSTTSLIWQDHWPLKPDIVLEGGNVGMDSISAVWFHSLSLLTTHHQPLERSFTTANATSAATALASRLAAQVLAVYPELWPETVRALIVHSAEWTNTMMHQFLPNNPSERDYQNLLRRCGFGVPDLDRALWSIGNSLTMVVEESLHPFKREPGKLPTFRDIHLHNLPWPRDVLEDLGETRVEMRITLSYFIEPNPSRRGVRSRYRYESHGLRFDVKRPLESTDEFRKRINLAARDEEEGTRYSGNDPSWLIGSQGRHRGSLHSDIWRGTAADLASRGNIAVYPALGWWKTRHSLERYDQTARYALVVSIKAPEVDVDLYTEVENRIATPVKVEF